eukprot:CAMPEP_0117680784 /NCGR_PEP_ID=MMETSP0804-20121206/18567_1 /TAXON_ID=1074897 /ORGANISM="Tetraselmis astigmatica, Strain CCMP880" /LENGTH=178 /DNA_ID=CAMNT_0005490365 /DNA_START=236 /DNA_END=769 /DNA_ORIENTATION=+
MPKPQCQQHRTQNASSTIAPQHRAALKAYLAVDLPHIGLRAMERHGDSTQVKAYYFLFFLSSAAIIPYLNIEFRRAGLSESEIGVVAAFRPWIAALCSYLVPSMADNLSYVYWPGLVTAVPWVTDVTDPFWAVLAAMLLSDALYTPCTVLADAAVVDCLTDPASYGRIRMWGTAGWGV